MLKLSVLILQVGDGGKAHKLRVEQKDEEERLKGVYGFNQLVSDEIRDMFARFYIRIYERLNIIIKGFNFKKKLFLLLCYFLKNN